MSLRCAIVDYGRGNLYSVSQALEQCGAGVVLATTPDELKDADRVVLPGVGAFGAASADLARCGLDQALLAFADTGRPLLGICLGMQLMFEWSEEFGHHHGLGLFPGHVAAIPATAADGRPHKVPHIGWNELVPPSAPDGWAGTILGDIAPGASVYFVHSFRGIPRDGSDRLADCIYNGQRITAAVHRGSIWGCQFHPEKSGETGLRILSRFLRL